MLLLCKASPVTCVTTRLQRHHSMHVLMQSRKHHVFFFMPLHAALCPSAQSSAPCSAQQYATALHALHSLNSFTDASLRPHADSPQGFSPNFAMSSRLRRYSKAFTRVAVVSASRSAPLARSTVCTAGFVHVS